MVVKLKYVLPIFTGEYNKIRKGHEWIVMLRGVYITTNIVPGTLFKSVVFSKRKTINIINNNNK